RGVRTGAITPEKVGVVFMGSSLGGVLEVVFGVASVVQPTRIKFAARDRRRAIRASECRRAVRPAPDSLSGLRGGRRWPCTTGSRSGTWRDRRLAIRNAKSTAKLPYRQCHSRQPYTLKWRADGRAHHRGARPR